MTFRASFIAFAAALAFAAPGHTAELRMGEPVRAPQGQELANLVARLNYDSGLSPDHDLRLAAAHPGAMGTRTLRLDHTYKGLRVWGSQSVVTTNSAGEVISRGGTDLRGALTSARQTLDVTPRLSPTEAVALARGSVVRSGRDLSAPTTELIVYPLMSTVRTPAAVAKPEAQLNALDLQTVVSGHALAYLVQTRTVVAGRVELWDTIVDAGSGKELARISAKHETVPAPGPAIGTGFSQYNGTVPLATTFDGAQFLMKDTTRGVGGTFGGMAITNADHAGAPNGTLAGLYTNATNIWGDGLQYINGGSTTNANGQTAAVNAMWGLMNTYDTMNNVLGWKSLDGNNTATYISVHVNTLYDNAFYSSACKCMAIGDGSASVNGLTNMGTVDTIGHEMGHGVTDATSKLIYAGESGALNESSSDINGEMVEAYARAGGTGATVPAGNDWVVLREASVSGVPFRFFAKPSKNGLSPDAWYNGIGSLDVHDSSGPNNRMFYFLSQGSNGTVGNDAYSSYFKRVPKAMTGIGNDRAYRIWFRANTTKFTPTTNYADARAKMIEAAQELYGVGSKEEIAVKRAYAGINVGTDVDEIGYVYVPTVSIDTPPASTAVTIGKVASFTVVPVEGKAPYYYLWYKNGARVRSATGPTYSFTTTAADANASIYVIVTDSSAVPTSARSAAATLTLNPVGTVYERMVNGDFERGTAGWSGNTGEIRQWTGANAPYQGLWNAWLGGFGRAFTDPIYQRVTLPADITQATLSFALKILTAETTTTVANDVLTVAVVNSDITATLGLWQYSNLDKSSGYIIRTLDLTPFKGQTIWLFFQSDENASLQTSFLIDAVSLKTD